MISKRTGFGSSSYPAVRIYGQSPYQVAVLHGGPGAPGYMAPVARELSKAMGVIEPLQSKGSLQGQIQQLAEQLSMYADKPIVLIGSSWGAVLALFTAARKSPDFSKLILIGSAVFDKQSSERIEKIRMDRLTDEQKIRFEKIKLKMANANSSEMDELVKQWGEV
ncbi:MAG: alpha/beta hydrolase, partial [candidate division Zixibacteria bacterium]|nr:alpha/beta hydrolase [candidate division Zixibacteria bacterium]